MPSGFRPTFAHLLRRAWLAGAAGGFAGFLIGGVGGRLAMFILRLTSDDFVRGAESDDGFTIGRFSFETGFLLIVTAALGSVAAIAYMSVRPALPVRWRRAMWATLCGAIGGAAIIHSDGIDFNLLEPTALAGVGIVPGAVIVATAIVAVVAQVDVLRSIATHVALRAAVCVGLAGLIVLALADLTDDVRTLL